MEAELISLDSVKHAETKQFNTILMFLATRLHLYVEKAKHVKVFIARAHVKAVNSAPMIGKLAQKENVLTDVL